MAKSIKINRSEITKRCNAVNAEIESMKKQIQNYRKYISEMQAKEVFVNGPASKKFYQNSEKNMKSNELAIQQFDTLNQSLMNRFGKWQVNS